MANDYKPFEAYPIIEKILVTILERNYVRVSGQLRKNMNKKTEGILQNA